MSTSNAISAGGSSTAGADRIHLADTLVGPSSAGDPILAEIDAVKGANKNTILYYTGDDLPASDSTHVYWIDDNSVVTVLEKPGLDPLPRVHLTETAVGPSVSGFPNLAEAQAAITTAGIVSNTVYYTADDLPASEGVLVYQVDSAGTATLIYKADRVISLPDLTEGMTVVWDTTLSLNAIVKADAADYTAGVLNANLGYLTDLTEGQVATLTVVGDITEAFHNGGIVVGQDNLEVIRLSLPSNSDSPEGGAGLSGVVTDGLDANATVIPVNGSAVISIQIAGGQFVYDDLTDELVAHTQVEPAAAQASTVTFDNSRGNITGLHVTAATGVTDVNIDSNSLLNGRTYGSGIYWVKLTASDVDTNFVFSEVFKHQPNEASLAVVDIDDLGTVSVQAGASMMLGFVRYWNHVQLVVQSGSSDSSAVVVPFLQMGWDGGIDVSDGDSIPLLDVRYDNTGMATPYTTGNELTHLGSLVTQVGGLYSVNLDLQGRNNSGSGNSTSVQPILIVINGVETELSHIKWIEETISSASARTTASHSGFISIPAGAVVYFKYGNSITTVQELTAASLRLKLENQKANYEPTMDGATRTHLTATQVGAADSIQPDLVSEIQVAVTGLGMTSQVLFYTGTDLSTDDILHVYHVDAAGNATQLGSYNGAIDKVAVYYGPDATGFTLLTSDLGKYVSTDGNVTLPAAGPADIGKSFLIYNRGTVSYTISSASLLIGPVTIPSKGGIMAFVSRDDEYELNGGV